MGERSDEYYRATYELDQVITLLGLREGWRGKDARHVTVVDVLSWAHDPGGDRTFFFAALQREPNALWMARRGPLRPDSESGAMLWDLLRAMTTIDLRSTAILAMKAFGLTYRDIAQVLRTSKDEISRTIWGTPRAEGAVQQVTRAMNNGGGAVPRPGRDDARIAFLRGQIRQELLELRHLLAMNGDA